MAALRVLERYEEAMDNFDDFFDRYAHRMPARQQAAAYIRRGWIHRHRNDPMGTASDYLRAYTTQTDWNAREQATVLIRTVSQLEQVLDHENEQRILQPYLEEARGLLASADPELKQTPAWQSDWAYVLARQSSMVQDSARAIAKQAVAALTPDVNPHTQMLVYRMYAQHLIDDNAFDEAERYLQRIESVLSTVDQEGLRIAYRARVANLRGRIALKTRRLREAQKHFAAALASYRSISNLRNMTAMAFLLARTHEKAGDSTNARRQYQQARRLADSTRQTARGTEWASLGTRQWSGISRGLMRMHLQTGNVRAALRTVDRSRSQLVQDVRRQARAPLSLSPRNRARFDHLTRAVQSIRMRLASDSLSERERRRLRERSLVLTQERQQLIAFPTRPPSLSLEAVQAVLRDQNRTLLAYSFGPAEETRDDAPLSVAFVVTPDTLQAVPLPTASRDSVQADLAAASSLFANPEDAITIESTQFDLRPLHRLYQRLVAPLRSLLPPGRRLTVVPDGPLFHVPFSLLVSDLPTEAPARHYEQATYLGDVYPITTALSASLVADPFTNAPVNADNHSRDLVAFGMSEFNTASQPSYDRPLPLLRTSRAGLEDLPNVEAELKAITSGLQRTSILYNRAATETAFHAMDTPPQIVHVASHALTNDQSPLYNAIVLSPDSTAPHGPSGDGFLYLHEIQSYMRRIPLVALSGCNTAWGSLRSGTTTESLQSAFRAVGAQSTLSALWETDDRAAVELTTMFYRFLREGHPKDIALQKTRQAYREEHPNASPFFWAPLVVYGSPQALPLSSPLLPRALGGLLALAITAGLGYGAYRRWTP